MTGYIRFLSVTFICLMSLTEVNAKRLPSVKLRNITGKMIDTATISNDGNPVIISFFALWCKPCLRELTAIADVYDDWQQQTGVKLIAVSIDDSRSTDKVRSEMNAREFGWDVLLDANSDFKRAMNINQIPHTIILDGKGEIVWQHSSYTDGGEEEIKRVLFELSNRTNEE